MEFYSKTNSFRGRNHHFGYGELRNVEKIFFKKTQETVLQQQIEVLEEMKRGVKEIQHLWGKISQNMDQLSKYW